MRHVLVLAGSLTLLACASTHRELPELNLAADTVAAAKESEPEPVGQVASTTGQLQIRAARTGQLTNARKGNPVAAGDTLVSANGGRAKIIFKDKNEIEVSPNTELELERYETTPSRRSALIKLVTGRVRARVPQKLGPEERFQVKTPAPIAGVRGTDFITSYDYLTKKTQVVAFEGTVEFGLPTPGGGIADSVAVSAGQSSATIGDAPPTKPTAVPKAELETLDRDTRVADAATAATDAPAPAAVEPASPVSAPAPAPTAPTTAVVTGSPSPAPVEASVALTWLQHGNERFVKRRLRADGQSVTDVRRVAERARPHAIVLGCSESQVPPELIFDQKLGELVVVRTLGEALSNSVVASLEHALNVSEPTAPRLLVVLGHTRCAALHAARATPMSSDPTFVTRIRSHLRTCAPSEDLANEALANARGVIEELQTRAPAVQAAVARGALTIKAAVYNGAGGTVMFE